MVIRGKIFEDIIFLDYLLIASCEKPPSYYDFQLKIESFQSSTLDDAFTESSSLVDCLSPYKNVKLILLFSYPCRNLQKADL